MNGDEQVTWQAASPSKQRKRQQEKMARMLLEAMEKQAGIGGVGEGYLTGRQERYFKQKQRPKRPETMSMMGRISTPEQQRLKQEKQEKQQGDFLKQMQAVYKERRKVADDIEKDTRKEQAALGKEERGAARKQDEAMQKRLWKLQDDLSKAKTEEERAQIQANLDALTGADEEPELTPEEQQEISGALAAGPTKIPEIEEEQTHVQELILGWNKRMDETDSAEDKQAAWRHLETLGERAKSLVVDKKYYEDLMAREPELVAYEEAIATQEKVEREQELQDLETAAAAREAEDVLAAPPSETREQEVARELGKLDKELGIRDTFAIKREKRAADRKITDEKRKWGHDAAMEILRQKGKKDPAFEKYANYLWRLPTEKELNWQQEVSDIEEHIADTQKLRITARKEDAKEEEERLWAKIIKLKNAKLKKEKERPVKGAYDKFKAKLAREKTAAPVDAPPVTDITPEEAEWARANRGDSVADETLRRLGE